MYVIQKEMTMLNITEHRELSTVMMRHRNRNDRGVSGTWKLKMVSDGIFIMDWEGELVE
jgi:hypothetical protein